MQSSIHALFKDTMTLQQGDVHYIIISARL